MNSPNASAPQAALGDSIAAALSWWRDAGVDLAFVDEPQAWLAEPKGKAPATPAPKKAAPPPEPERPRIGGDPANWPQDLVTFRQWWLEEQSLDPVAGQRVPSHGEAGAKLMVMVPMPEEEDTDTLLSGPQGRFVANMAKAMGFSPEEVFVASALPRNMALPDWQGLARDGMGDVLRHHIALAEPKRLIILGTDILSLLGHDLAQPSSSIQQLDIRGGTVPLLAGYAPAHLLEHARLRKRLWQQWLDWIDEDR